VNTANLLKDISGYSVRIGAPRRFFTTSCEGLNSPAATTCAGLIMEARKHPHINCAEVPETIEVEMAPPQREELFPDETPVEQDQPGSQAEVKEKKAEPKKPKKEKTIKVVKPQKPPKEPREIRLPNWIKKIGEFQETLFDGMDERSDESINNKG
jgi:cell division ATPase FtsA